MARRVRVIDRIELVLRINMASEVGLLDDARQNMRTLIDAYGRELTKEERNLFAVFYKRLLIKHRNEYKLFTDILAKLPPDEDLKRRIVQEYISRARREIILICQEVAEKIRSDIRGLGDAEIEIFFMKLLADYYRYWAEVAEDDQFTIICARANEAYLEAYERANQDLALYHPLRLGIMLNLSIQLYEVEKNRLKAIQLAMKAVTEGKDHVDEDPDIREAVNLLRDNLDTWMSVLGPAQVEELERLEGARKWFGEGEVRPSASLVLHLSEGTPPRYFGPPIRQRHWSEPQPNQTPPMLRSERSRPYKNLKEKYSELFGPVIETDEPSVTIDEPQDNRYEALPSTSGIRCTAAHPRPAVVQNIPSPRSALEMLPVNTRSNEGVDPLYELYYSSSSSPFPQQEEEDEENMEDNADPEGLRHLPYYREAVTRTSESRDIPRANILETDANVLHLDEKLRSFESKMFPAQQQHEESTEPVLAPGEWRITPPGERQHGRDPELLRPSPAQLEHSPEIFRAVQAVAVVENIEASSSRITTAAAQSSSVECRGPGTGTMLLSQPSETCGYEIHGECSGISRSHVEQPVLVVTDTAPEPCLQSQHPDYAISPQEHIQDVLEPEAFIRPRAYSLIVFPERTVGTASSFLSLCDISEYSRWDSYSRMHSRFPPIPRLSSKHITSRISRNPRRTLQQSSALPRYKRLLQRTLLPRSFSVPRENAPFSTLSLVRRPPFYFNTDLRSFTATYGHFFGRRFLSAHSSAEELLDEVTERAFSNSRTPAGLRTMLAPLYPRQESRLSGSRVQRLPVTPSNVQNPSQSQPIPSGEQRQSMEENQPSSSGSEKDEGSGSNELPSSYPESLPSLVNGDSSDSN